MSESLPTRKIATIFTALEVETRAVLRQLGRFTDETVSGTCFFKGQFEGWDIVVAEVGAGNVGAAAIAVRGVEHYKPSVALFVGVAGGVKDVVIGDVVVGTAIYGYESGKDLAGGFKARPDVMKTAHNLQQRARVMRQRDHWKNRLDSTVKHEDPRVFVGPIAAGEKVVASKRSATAKLIKEHYGDALAVEMEGRGFLEGVHLSHPVQGCVVRGVSDLLSGKRNADKAGSQRRAADVASAVAFEILSTLDGNVVAAATKSAQFIETKSTFIRSAYFEEGEVLAQVGEPRIDQVSFSFARAPEAFLRIIPTQQRKRPIPVASLKEVVGSSELLRATGFDPGLTCINKHGAIRYEPTGPHRIGPGPLHRATQLFQNGELWCISDSIIVREREHRPAWVLIPFIAASGFEQAFYRALHQNIKFCVDYLDLRFPCTVELGLIGIGNVYLAISHDDIRGPIQADDAIVRTDLSDSEPAAINELLLEFFNDVYDKTGYPRPLGLHGFPPGAPSP